MSRDTRKKLILVLSLLMLAGACQPARAATYNGVYIDDGSICYIGQGSDIHTNSIFHPGLEALYAGSTISADDNVRIRTTDGWSEGVLANTDGTIRIGRSADIATQGRTSHGVEAWDGGSVYLGAGGTVETNGHFSIGLWSGGGDKAALISADDDLTITTNYAGGNPGDPSDQNSSSFGILARNDGFVEIGDRLKVTTHGTSSSAVRVDQGGDVRIGRDAVITTHGKWASGIDARGDNYVYIGDNAKISTGGYNADGMLVLWGGNVFAGDDLAITTSLDLSYSHDYSRSNGIWVEGAGSSADIGDRLKVTTYGAQSRGIGVWDEGTVEIGDGGVIETHGFNALGLWVNAKGGTASFTAGDGLTINTYAKHAQGGDPFDVTNPYDYAHAIFAEVGATVHIGDWLTITTKGSASEGARAFAYNWDYDCYEDVLIKIGKNARITTEGEISHGLFAQYEGALISVDNGLRVTTSGDMANGLYALDYGKIETGDEIRVSTSGQGAFAAVAYESGTLDIGNKATLSTTGSYADALLSEGHVTVGDQLTVTTSGEGSYGVLAQYDGYMEIGKSADILTTNTSAIGAASLIGAELYFGGGLKVNTAGDYAYGVFANEGGLVEIAPGGRIITGGVEAHAVYTLSGGKVIVNGGTIIAGDSSANAIFAESSYYFNSTSRISGTGVFFISGDIVAQADYSDRAEVDLTMEDGSSFTGAAIKQGDNISETEIKLSLSGASTRWNVTGESFVDSLVLDGATVDFGAGGQFATLTADNLEGNSCTIIMRADMTSCTGDLLEITNSSTGTFTIKVADHCSGAVDENDTLTLVKDENGGAVFELAGGYANLGLWQYGIHSVAREVGLNWDIYSTGRASDPASAAVNSFAGSYLLAYAETQTLLQRMGDLRQSPHLNDLWFRVHGGKFESNSKSFVRGFDMDYGGVQIGYDRKIGHKWNGDIYAGVMFGYSKGDLDYDKHGSGEVDSKKLGVYGVYVRPDGFYADVILKYQWMTNDFDAIGADGSLIRGSDVDTGGFGASLEVGKRFQVGRSRENYGGWYVEPQLQLSYQRQDGGWFSADGGQLRIGIDPFTSLLGRVGMLVGYETDRTNLYAKVSKVKEFDGDLTVRSGSAFAEESFGDDWWVYGIGVTSRINDRNSLYFDVERASGGSFSQPWRVTAGWRLEF